MANLSGLNETDLNILDALSRSTAPLETGVLAQLLGLSSSQIIKRGKVLQSQGFLTMEDGGPRRIYRFSLGPETTRADINQIVRARTLTVTDPVARSTLLAFCQLLEEFNTHLSEFVKQTRIQLGEEDNT